MAQHFRQASINAMVLLTVASSCYWVTHGYLPNDPGTWFVAGMMVGIVPTMVATILGMRSLAAAPDKSLRRHALEAAIKVAVKPQPKRRTPARRATGRNRKVAVAHGGNVIPLKRTS